MLIRLPNEYLDRMETVGYADKEGVKRILERSATDYSEAFETVKAIIDDVKRDGDEALSKYSLKFDRFDLNHANIRVHDREIDAAYKHVDRKVLESLRHAHKNIRAFHRMQHKVAAFEWEFETEKGVRLWEAVNPIESAGCYVPGGRAAYPSTVLMTCTPAKIAGVRRIAVVSPPPISPAVLVACDIAGVDEIYRVGGAQAVAALAYGTKSIRKVSKIVGPGNKYVTAAKMMVYGAVDIDMPAGPSEVLILADDSASPKFIALDLLAQAEHDPDAKSVLVSHSGGLIEKVSAELHKNRIGLGRKHGEIVAVKTRTLEESVGFANEYAPEHLEVVTKNAEKTAGKIKNAGAIFIGPYSCVAAGDYASGANHVLPTGGTAKYSSQLSVRDFMKSSSIQKISREGLHKLGRTIMTLAQEEGLPSHTKSVEERLSDDSVKG